ncbi:hypothetical protein KBK24_0137285 [Burkholderia sp. K24]|nr:hypothetical protein KBK24_0137285 [Burkholderia sp. K24]
MSAEFVEESVAQLEAKARMLLGGKWERPNEIAWAWVTLLTIERGEEIIHAEPRYREILATELWIDGLKLPSAQTADGRHGMQAKGAELRVRVAAVKAAAIAEDRPWPADAIVKPNPALPAGGDWQDRARQLAQEIGERKWRSGQREITARSIAKPVAVELGKDHRYFGSRGPRSPNNIRSEALKGWRFQPPE